MTDDEKQLVIDALKSGLMVMQLDLIEAEEEYLQNANARQGFLVQSLKELIDQSGKAIAIVKGGAE